MQHVLARLKQRCPELHVLTDADLGGLRRGAFEHARIELLGRMRLAKIVLARDAVELVIEEHVSDTNPIEPGRSEICGGTAGKGIGKHAFPLWVEQVDVSFLHYYRTLG